MRYIICTYRSAICECCIDKKKDRTMVSKILVEPKLLVLLWSSSGVDGYSSIWSVVHDVGMSIVNRDCHILNFAKYVWICNGCSSL